MIYLATDDDGMIKVGWSHDPVGRCRALHARLLRTFRIPPHVEEWLHTRLRCVFPAAPPLPGRRGKGARGGREWYQPWGVYEGEVVETLPTVEALLTMLEGWSDGEDHPSGAPGSTGFQVGADLSSGYQKRSPRAAVTAGGATIRRNP